MRVANWNLASKLANSVVILREMPLAPLYNIKTGAIVANCPNTLRELERCNGKLKWYKKEQIANI